MKIYVLSRVQNGEILIPRVSTNFQKLCEQAAVEYENVLKNAGHLGSGYKEEDGTIVAHYGACKHIWKIDEVDY